MAEDPRVGPLIGKAKLYYAAGGAGKLSLPGGLEWRTALGRYWSHSYAQRIIEDPLDPSDPPDSHVWLITDTATFREYGNPDPFGTYQTLRPSDDYRTLYRTSAGWELHDLDGTVTAFDNAGRWTSTTDRNNNAFTGFYTGDDLTLVTLPDGRSEELGYVGGRLETVTEVGVGGGESRTWTLTWNGDDLQRLDNPDDTAWEMTYGDTRHDGYMTLLEWVGSDGTSRRVETGWQYDAEGNVVALWRGDDGPDEANAVDVWRLAFDDPAAPTVTTVTDPLALPGQETVYTYGRDSTSERLRMDSIDGDCPACGVGPNAVFTYGDAANPLRPTTVVDGNGHQTDSTYDPHGQVLTRTEAVGTSEERTTTYAYDPAYPALVTEASVPSVEAGQLRRTIYTRDGFGNATHREIRGWEEGDPFDCTVSLAPCFDTVTGYNAQGQPTSIDPPGYGTADETSFTYDPARGSLVADSRTDPVVGTTAFDYDAYNRRTAVTDPNGVTTQTQYDDLDRVTKVIQKGASPAEDLVTEHVYTPLGDLDHTILPAGKVIDYGYDAAGRLTSVERKPDLATPGERTVYQLDDAGNRTREDLERWNGSAWVTDATTSYLYTTRCHLDQVLYPDGSITEHDYDCNGNLERTWDANHPSAGKTATATATYGYDELDRLTAVARPWDGEGGGMAVTTYGYDVQDHLTAVTDAEASTTTYTYSDRDLLTAQSSLVSGTTTHAYNAHGELVETVDARGLSELRSVDALDRVTFVDYPDYPDDSLDTTYTYDDPLVAFSLGRLTAIERGGSTVEYGYDRFGRIIQDGELTYAHDENGNVTTIGYPGGVSATYGYDFADRETSLSVTTAAGTTPVVTTASYLPSGPLTSLTLGNDAVENHVFDGRYLPMAITLDASDDRTWAYQTDDVGNVTEITEMAACPGDLVLANTTVPDNESFTSCATIHAGPELTVQSGGGLTLRAADRIVFYDGFKVESGGRLDAGTDPSLAAGDVTKSYGYQDFDYFLTSAAGPWGSQSWTYDKIGNRLTETDNGATETLPLRRQRHISAAGRMPHRPPDQHRPRHPRHPQLRLHRRRPRRLRHRRRQRRRLRVGRRRPPRAVDEPQRHQPLPLRRPRLPALRRRRRHRRHRHPDLRLGGPPPQPAARARRRPDPPLLDLLPRWPPGGPARHRDRPERPLVVPHHRPPRHPHRRHRRRPGHPLEEQLRTLRQRSVGGHLPGSAQERDLPAVPGAVGG